MKSARLLALQIDLTHCTTAAAFLQFGDLLPTFDWQHTKSGLWDHKVVYSNPLTHTVVELLLACQRQDRQDLVRCLCSSDEKIPPEAIDVSTRIGQQIVGKIGDLGPDNESVYLLLTAGFTRCDDNSTLAVMTLPVYRGISDLAILCALQAFWFGRVTVFRELIEKPIYHTLDRQRLDTSIKTRYNSQYSMTPLASADMFIYCVNGSILDENIWNYVSIWNEMPQIASFVAGNPSLVPQISIPQIWRIMRLSIGRLAPNIVAQILRDLSVNLEDLWNEKMAPDFVRCPHLVEEIEAHFWAYLLANGKFDRSRFQNVSCHIHTSTDIFQSDSPRNSLRWCAVYTRLDMLITEIYTKFCLCYKDAMEVNLSTIPIEKDMWWPTSSRVDVDYW